MNFTGIYVHGVRKYTRTYTRGLLGVAHLPSIEYNLSMFLLSPSVYDTDTAYKFTIQHQSLPFVACLMFYDGYVCHMEQPRCVCHAVILYTMDINSHKIHDSILHCTSYGTIFRTR